MLNVRKLRRELYPEDHAREVSHLREQELRLRRRLYLAQRLGGLSLEELQRRRQALAENVRDLTARLESRARNADDPRLGLSRVDEVAAALGTEGAPLAELARTVGTPRLADADADFSGRRQEGVDLLDAVAARPDLEEGVRRRVDVLRARLFSLRPGEGSAAGLRRALAQREADLARVDDELKLRSDGVVAPAEPNTGLFQAAAALRQAQARLAELAVVESFPAVTEPAARERKEAALLAL